jgi:type III restriction enzyme
MAKASSPQRTARRIKVEPEDVRASGLLKDTLDIRHPEDSQPSDATLTRLAAENIKEMTQKWKDYSESQNEPLVVPVMVVQVRDGETEAGYREILTTLKDAWPELSDRAIGHSLESHSTLEVDHWSIRYVAPENIQDDADLKVVLFKQALTTGWDCPRAETMLSFRRAEDYTYIAQLIGRMVRTPLARRIVTDDSLNVVSLFLPYYARESVDAVVEKLQSDPTAPPIEIVSNLVNYSKNPNVDPQVFSIIESLPSYVVPGRIHKSQIARLHAFASRLAGDGVLLDAVTSADTMLLDLLKTLRASLEGEGKFQQLVKELGRIEIGKVSVQLLAGGQTSEKEEAITDVRDINAVFRRAKQSLTDGLAEIYWDNILDEALARGEMLNPDEVKIDVAALASDSDVVSAVENAAGKLVAEWFLSHGKDIAKLQASAQSAYQPIRAQAKASEQTSILLPSVVSIPGGQTPRTYSQHIFASADDECLFTLNDWEHEVVMAELGARSIAWYRNPTGGEKSLRVPYFDTSGEKAMYPDFIFFESVNGKVVPSIVDPHNYALADTSPKWRGLSEYAVKHGTAFGRIDAVIKTPDGVLKKLDLKNSDVRDALENSHTGDDILAIFAKHGSAL